MTKPKIILNIGSNLGNKLRNISLAMRMLKNKVDIGDFSKVYATDSLLEDSQERYFNVALLGYTFLSPEELLFFVKSIESKMGRVPFKKWGERIIDIDIIDYNNEFFKSDQLQIPHEGLPKRVFFIYPLMDVCPDYIFPDRVTSLKQILNNIDKMLNIKKLGELKWQ